MPRKKVSEAPRAPDRSWPADKVERRTVDSLVPYARNARTHSADQVDQIAESITEWGWTVPVLLDEAGGILAGHGRVLAAKKLGLVDVPCMVAVGWSEAQKRAYVIADNKLALNSGWDDELLKAEFSALKLDGFDLELTGFDVDDIDALFGAAGGETTYSRKLKPPVYVPKGDTPALAELVDEAKADGLKAEIAAASVPDDVKAFLAKAADRHVVFDFHRIADYYAAAPADVQQLMERSALVIIDFGQAIENGFVRLNQRLGELADQMVEVDAE